MTANGDFRSFIDDYYRRFTEALEAFDRDDLALGAIGTSTAGSRFLHRFRESLKGSPLSVGVGCALCCALCCTGGTPTT